MTQQQTVLQPQRISLENLFAIQAITEQVIREKVAVMMQRSIRIGCTDLARLDDIDALTAAANVVNQITKSLLTIMDQRDKLPAEIYSSACGHDYRYAEIWREPLALLDDAVLFLVAHHDCLLRDSIINEHVERQRSIRVHLLHCHRAFLEAFRNTSSWRDEVCEDTLANAGYEDDQNEDIPLISAEFHGGVCS